MSAVCIYTVISVKYVLLKGLCYVWLDGVIVRASDLHFDDCGNVGLTRCAIR